MGELTGKQRRYLRALGHHLAPVMQIGHEGLSDAVVSEANAQLDVHELIKVKVGESSPVSRHDAAAALADKTSSAVAQVLGRTFLLYRRRSRDPHLKLPT
jgi:RNA-binding protein